MANNGIIMSDIQILGVLTLIGFGLVACWIYLGERDIRRKNNEKK